MRCPLEKVLVGIVRSFHSRETWGGWQTMSHILGLAGLGAQSEGFGRRGDRSPPGWPVLVGCSATSKAVQQVTCTGQ